MSTGNSEQDVVLHRGEIWDCLGPGADDFRAFTNGGLAVSGDGKIVACNDFPAVAKQFPHAKIIDHGDGILMPGFIDTHLHFPQLGMIGAYGKGLLDWLNEYTFPEERKFHNRRFAEVTAKLLCAELLKNGVTTAAIYSSVHFEATDALFAAAQDAGLRAIIGRTAMDRLAPPDLTLDMDEQIASCEKLITKWHKPASDMYYAITPRFAPACSPKLLAALGALRSRHPDVYVQSHHAETPDEVRLVAQLFPESANYMAVYAEHGLNGKLSIFGHSIYATPTELKMMAEHGAAIAHCPTSNMFLGSGLMAYRRLRDMGIAVALGSDIGAGTSLSPLRTMTAAYKTQALLRNPIHPSELLYLATLGGAAALSLDKHLGNFLAGKWADFSVFHFDAVPLLALRLKHTSDPLQRLFSVIIQGDDRLTSAVYRRGKQLLHRPLAT